MPAKAGIQFSRYLPSGPLLSQGSAANILYKTPPPTDHLCNQFRRPTPNQFNPLREKQGNLRNPLRTGCILARMDQPAAPEQDRINGLIGQAALLAIWLADELRRRLVPLPGQLLETRLLRHLVRHYLLPAEAAVRRAVHLIAAEMRLPQPAPRAARTAARKLPLKPQSPKTPRAPAFRLTEPQPRPKTDHIPARLAPRIRLLTPGLPAIQPHPKPPARQSTSYEERLRRRFAALEAALASPVQQARRLLRLQARQSAPKPLLSLSKIPGYRSRPITDTGRAALDAINMELLERQQRTADTS
jgi:hypothetical protein